MARLSPEDAARIAMQYDAVVPDDITVDRVPSGCGVAWGISLSRRDAVDRGRRIYQRMMRFKHAARKGFAE